MVNTTNENRIDMHPSEYHISTKICNSKMGVKYNPHSKTIKYINDEEDEPFVFFFSLSTT